MALNLINPEENELMINVEDLPNFRLVPDGYSGDIAQKNPNSVEVARNFIQELQRALKIKNQEDLLNIYDYKFNKLSEMYFRNAHWPTPEELEQAYEDIEIDINTQFLYLELTYRHIYARIQIIPVDIRIKSWQNYLDLFDVITNSKNRDDLVLPVPWIWDILDEFVYQYQTFCQFRARMKEDDANFQELCQTEDDFWNLERLQACLKNIVEKSGILKGDLTALKSIHYFGLFSIVSQLRLNVLIGDYDAAIKSVEAIDGRKLPILSKAYAGLMALFYYVGFCYLIRGRYKEAVKMLEVLLSFIIKHRQFFSMSFQHEALNKQADRSLSLLAIALIFYPTTVDESVSNLIKEQLGERFEKLQKYDVNQFNESFMFGCPKLIVPVKNREHFKTLGFERTVLEPVNQQREHLLAEFSKIQQLNNISSVLKLYTSIHISKIAKVMKLNDAQLRELLNSYKNRNKVQLGDSPFETTVVSRFLAGSSHLDFVIENDVVKISEITEATNYNKLLLKYNQRLEDMIQEIQSF